MTSYREAGVDQLAADALVPVYAQLSSRTHRPEVTGALGGFAGLFSLENLKDRGYSRPALVASTDTTGTKIELLARDGLHHTAGWDAVAMNVDDVVCSGAEPLLFVDCIAIERLDKQIAEQIVAGVADACIESGCSLVGGETAQLPGLLRPGAYEVMGTCIGVVDLDRVWGPHRVKAGDAVVGLASSGPHSNGFALVRKLLETFGGDPPQGLLEPTSIYARPLLSAAARVEVHAAAHVTGGGIASNLARALPAGLGAELDRSAWPVPRVFEWIASRGVPDDEMLEVFNMGLGMLVLVPDAGALVRALAAQDVRAWHVGAVTERAGVRIR